MMAPRNVLPEAIRRLPLSEKIQRLANLSEEKVHALEVLVDIVLENAWRENFYAGPRGGQMLKSAKPGLESDRRARRAIAEKGGAR
jgi:hypothetical protein